MSASVSQLPLLMGIVNVTPDSFSDGGDFYDAAKAIKHGLRLAEEGADILDVGGESTRPGAETISVQEEMDRVLPVIEGLKNSGKEISIDTRNAATMSAALAAGASIINDVTALEGDNESLGIAAQSDAKICLMHMQGEPQTMQEAPHYDDVCAEVYTYLESRVAACVAAGISKDRLYIDPGIGFGKTLAHNLALLKNLNDLSKIGVPVLLGLSRKRFIEKIYPEATAQKRLSGSLAGAIWGAANGATVLRVHDVAETVQALSVYAAIQQTN